MGKSPTTLDWTSVREYAAALEEHSKGSVAITLLPTGGKRAGEWLVSVVHSAPLLESPGNTYGHVTDGYWPNVDCKTLEAYCYLLLHQADLEWTLAHSQKELPDL